MRRSDEARGLRQASSFVSRSRSWSAPRIGDVMPPERIYRGSVRAFSLVFMALGALILSSTLLHGGGPLSVGTLLGLAFLAVGAGRLWIASRT
jgi:hypothetical protein